MQVLFPVILSQNSSPTFPEVPYHIKSWQINTTIVLILWFNMSNITVAVAFVKAGFRLITECFQCVFVCTTLLLLRTISSTTRKEMHIVQYTTLYVEDFICLRQLRSEFCGQDRGQVFVFLCSQLISPHSKFMVAGYITASAHIPIQCTEVPWPYAAGVDSLSLASQAWPHQVLSCLVFACQRSRKLSKFSRQRKVFLHHLLSHTSLML